MAETGFIIFYVTFYALIGLLGYYAGDALGVEDYTLDVPTLVVPETFAPAELGDTSLWNITEAVINFLAWGGYIIVFIIAGLAFGIELLIYLLALNGLTAFGLPLVWSGTLSAILTTALIFVLVKTWKGG